ncbi:DNA-binding protein [Chytriomyces sp. MP71]|nr:DNA-binding protein [Chytriomyces sp. MP71]
MDYSSFMDCFVDFLEVAIHTILYERKVYPETVFEKAQMYNITVRRSRHPALNGYIMDFLMGIRVDLAQGAVHKIMLVILDTGSNPVEKFVFRIKDVYEHVTQQSKQSAVTNTSILELETYFHTIIQRLAFIHSSLASCVPDCTFSLLCELIDGKEFPQSYEEDVPWVHAESSIVHVTQSRITPLNVLDAGVVRVDVFLESQTKK